MKFLCDNCKAKYQIADEKAAGKTIRMKCRKCGHQIEVRAEVTETSVSTMPPATEMLDSKPPVRSHLATSLATQKPRAPQPAATTTGALAGAFQRTVQDGSSSSPPEAMGLDVSMTDEWYVAINGVPVGPVRISEIRRKAATGAVTEDSLCWQEGLEEWRPVRSVPELAAIVREAAQANRGSPVSAPLESPRASVPPRPPPQKPAPPAPRPGSMPPRSPEPPRVGSARPSTPKSNVLPFQGRTAASAHVDRPSFDDGARTSAPAGIGASAVAVVQAPQPTPHPSAQLSPVEQSAQLPASAPFAAPAPFSDVTSPNVAADIAADPFAIPPTSGVAGGAIAATVPETSAALTSIPPPAPASTNRQSFPLWLWPIIAFAAVFSLAAAYFTFGKSQPPQQIIVQVPVPTPTNTTPPPVASETAPAPTTPEPPPSATPSARTTQGPGKVAAATTPAEKKTVDLSGLMGNTNGPSTGSGGAGAGSGGGLDAASVQRVVRDRQAGVKRTCWERGGSDQKSSANVNVSVNVAPNGSVSSASATGDDPVVAKCIENQVKTWSFPAPGSQTTINIPFHFVRQ